MTTAASPFTGVERSGPTDDIDGLFDDLLDEDRRDNKNDTNNIDEEIKVTKKRKPVAKLDENRLLSTAGIPKLRKISKQKFKFNGKGNEFTDMAKLLNTYQLWLDDLFPKAKFLDALGMVEKLGHKKKIQIYRKEWIDEGKPKGAMDDLDDFVANGGDRMDDLDDFVADGERPLPAFNFRTGSIHEYDRPVREDQGGNTIREEDPEDDELDALLQDPPPAQNQTRPDRPWLQRDAEEPDDDELDALLAEDPSTNNGNKSLFGGPVNGSSKPKEKAHDDFDDEEEAMAGMDW